MEQSIKKTYSVYVTPVFKQKIKKITKGERVRVHACAARPPTREKIQNEKKMNCIERT